MRARAAALIGAAAAAVVVPAAASAASSRPTSLTYLADGRFVTVERRTASIRDTVRALLAGPTVGERGRGIVSAVPAGTQLRDVEVRRRVVTVDLGARFAAGNDRAALQARVGQLVRTVGSIPGVAGVRILVEDGVPVGLFPGYDLRRPLTPAAVRERSGPSVRELQQLLVDLGFLARAGVTGEVDDRTSVAVLAFQKWARLPRDGALGPATVRALLRATRPVPELREPSRRVEVLLDRQLALLVDGDRVVRVVHISSGAYGRTPVGSFRVFRKERYSWSVPFSVTLPWASYFVGGIAFHEYPSVPAYPASHGCVRVNRYDAPGLFTFATHGTPVRVLASS
jgi:hypothetical protein